MKDSRKQGEGKRRPARADGRPARADGKPRRADGKPGRAEKPFKKKAPGSKPRDKNPAHQTVTGEGERISKIMARAGVASRRDCERMILAGRVSLNGTVLTTPAVNCTPADKIEVDGQPISAIERTRLWLYYKPAGLVTTNFDPEGRPTVFDNLPAELPRVISIGRLDINTEGLLLLTNDGGLARMLELPTTGWLRRYRVRAHGSIDQERLDSLKEGIAVDGIFYGSIEATLDREKGHNVWITMGLREGKNREIKNVLGALNLDVNRLIRISYGPFQLGELEEGQVVEVKSRTLREQLGPRLIEEASANFEAPISNLQKPKDEEAPEAGERPKREGREDRPRREGGEERPRREGRDERPRRESREERRERDLARIDTKRPVQKARKDGDRRRDNDDDDRKQKRPPLGTNRTANVWMAPGARPVATKKAKAETTTEGAEPRRRILRLKKDAAPDAGAAGEAKPKRAERMRRQDQAGRGERPERKGRPDRPAGEKPPGNKPARAKAAGAARPAGGEGGRFRASPSAEGRQDRERPPRAGKPENRQPAKSRPENANSEQGNSGNDGKDGGADRRG